MATEINAINATADALIRQGKVESDRLKLLQGEILRDSVKELVRRAALES